MSATATASPDWSQHIGVILAGIMLAVAIGKTWELTDRGDGRGDMLEAQDSPIVGGNYIDCDAGSNGDGSFANPWNSISAISMTQGDDLYFKRGSICEDQMLSVSWGGSAGNRAVVGCYYDVGGFPYSCRQGPNPIGPVMVNDTERPEINGTFEDSCRVSTAAIIPCEPSGSTVPNNQNEGLLKITSDYVTVQDLQFVDSNGRGFRTLNDAQYGVIDGVFFEYMFLQPGTMTAFESGFTLNGRFFVVRDSWFASWNWACENQSPGCTAGVSPGGLFVQGHRDLPGPWLGAQVLIQGNTFVDYHEYPIAGRQSEVGVRANSSRGQVSELINILRSTHAIVADNRAYGQSNYYCDNCTSSVFERNIAVVNLGGGTAFSSTIEDYQTQLPNADLLIRNNASTGAGICWRVNNGDPENQATKHGEVTVVGNTCYGALSASDATFGIDDIFGARPSPNSGPLTVKSNVIYSPEATGTGSWGPGNGNNPECRIQTSDNDTNSNLFSDGTNLNASCSGGAVIGDPLLAVSWLGQDIFHPVTRPVTFADFEPLVTSPVIGEGVNFTGENSSWLDEADFYNFGAMKTVGVCNDTALNWEKLLGCDATGAARTATQDIGATEYTP